MRIGGYERREEIMAMPSAQIGIWMKQGSMTKALEFHNTSQAIQLGNIK